MNPAAGDTSPTGHGCGCCNSEGDTPSPASKETDNPQETVENPAEVPTPAEEDTNLLAEDSRQDGGCCGGHAAPASGDTPEEEPVDKEELLADELKERTEDLQRLTAEYANYRRRTERDRSLVVANARASVVTEFLPVIDDLELAKKHDDLKGALKAIHDKLLSAFAKLDVVQFGEEGDAFDPEIHEALQDLSSGDDKAIGTVVRPGFMIGDRLLRTAMVIIADPPADEQ